MVSMLVSSVNKILPDLDMTAIPEWVSDCCFAPTISAISLGEQVNVQWDDDEIHFVQDQHA
jgi:hypothetical protein